MMLYPTQINFHGFAVCHENKNGQHVSWLQQECSMMWYTGKISGFYIFVQNRLSHHIMRAIV